MLNLIKLIMKSAIGYERDEAGEHVSWKKICFVLASLLAYVGPSVLLGYAKITGAEWLDFYKVIVPATITIYTAGKWVDSRSA